MPEQKELIPASDVINNPEWGSLDATGRAKALEGAFDHNLSLEASKHNQDSSPDEIRAFAENLQNEQQNYVALQKSVRDDFTSNAINEISQRTSIAPDNLVQMIGDANSETDEVKKQAKIDALPQEAKNLMADLRSRDYLIENSRVGINNSVKVQNDQGVPIAQGTTFGAGGQMYSVLDFFGSNVKKDDKAPAALMKLDALANYPARREITAKELAKSAEQKEADSKDLAQQSIDLKKMADPRNMGDDGAAQAFQQSSEMARKSETLLLDAADDTKKALTMKRNRNEAESNLMADDLRNKIKNDPKLLDYIPQGDNWATKVINTVGLGVNQTFVDTATGVTGVAERFGMADKSTVKNLMGLSQDLGDASSVSGFASPQINPTDAESFMQSVMTELPQEMLDAGLGLMLSKVARSALTYSARGMAKREAARLVSDDLLKRGVEQSVIDGVRKETAESLAAKFGERMGTKATAFIEGIKNAGEDISQTVMAFHQQADKLQSEADYWDDMAKNPPPQRDDGLSTEQFVKNAQSMAQQKRDEMSRAEEGAGLAFIATAAINGSMEMMGFEKLFKRNKDAKTLLEDAAQGLARKNLEKDAKYMAMSAGEQLVARTQAGTELLNNAREAILKDQSVVKALDKLKHAGSQGAVEGITETLQQISSNTFIQNLIDHNQEVFDGVGQSSAVGFTIGLLGGAVSAESNKEAVEMAFAEMDRLEKGHKTSLDEALGHVGAKIAGESINGLSALPADQVVEKPEGQDKFKINDPNDKHGFFDTQEYDTEEEAKKAASSRWQSLFESQLLKADLVSSDGSGKPIDNNERAAVFMYFSKIADTIASNSSASKETAYMAMAHAFIQDGSSTKNESSPTSGPQSPEDAASRIAAVEQLAADSKTPKEKQAFVSHAQMVKSDPAAPPPKLKLADEIRVDAAMKAGSATKAQAEAPHLPAQDVAQQAAPVRTPPPEPTSPNIEDAKKRAAGKLLQSPPQNQPAQSQPQNSPEKITNLGPNDVFVFGSNEAGRHGKGAALQAVKFGAAKGQGSGPQGSTFAVPTKDASLKTLPVEKIHQNIAKFIEHARQNPNKNFLVTALGTGLAGLSPEQVAPAFANAPSNVKLPASFTAALQKSNPAAVAATSSVISRESIGRTEESFNSGRWAKEPGMEGANFGSIAGYGVFAGHLSRILAGAKYATLSQEEKAKVNSQAYEAYTNEMMNGNPEVFLTKEADSHLVPGSNKAQIVSMVMGEAVGGNNFDKIVGGSRRATTRNWGKNQPVPGQIIQIAGNKDKSLYAIVTKTSKIDHILKTHGEQRGLEIIAQREGYTVEQVKAMLANPASPMSRDNTQVQFIPVSKKYAMTRNATTFQESIAASIVAAGLPMRRASFGPAESQIPPIQIPLANGETLDFNVGGQLSEDNSVERAANQQVVEAARFVAGLLSSNPQLAPNIKIVQDSSIKGPGVVREDGGLTTTKQTTVLKHGPAASEMDVMSAVLGEVYRKAADSIDSSVQTPPTNDEAAALHEQFFAALAGSLPLQKSTNQKENSLLGVVRRLIADGKYRTVVTGAQYNDATNAFKETHDQKTGQVTGRDGLIIHMVGNKPIVKRWSKNQKGQWDWNPIEQRLMGGKPIRGANSDHSITGKIASLFKTFALTSNINTSQLFTPQSKYTARSFIEDMGLSPIALLSKYPNNPHVIAIQNLTRMAAFGGTLNGSDASARKAARAFASHAIAQEARRMTGERAMAETVISESQPEKPQPTQEEVKAGREELAKYLAMSDAERAKMSEAAKKRHDELMGVVEPPKEVVSRRRSGPVTPHADVNPFQQASGIIESVRKSDREDLGDKNENTSGIIGAFETAGENLAEEEGRAMWGDIPERQFLNFGIDQQEIMSGGDDQESLADAFTPEEGSEDSPDSQNTSDETPVAAGDLGKAGLVNRIIQESGVAGHLSATLGVHPGESGKDTSVDPQKKALHIAALEAQLKKEKDSFVGTKRGAVLNNLKDTLKNIGKLETLPTPEGEAFRVAIQKHREALEARSKLDPSKITEGVPMMQGFKEDYIKNLSAELTDKIDSMMSEQNRIETALKQADINDNGQTSILTPDDVTIDELMSSGMLDLDGVNMIMSAIAQSPVSGSRGSKVNQHEVNKAKEDLQRFVATELWYRGVLRPLGEAVNAGMRGTETLEDTEKSIDLFAQIIGADADNRGEHGVTFAAHLVSGGPVMSFDTLGEYLAANPSKENIGSALWAMKEAAKAVHSNMEDLNKEGITNKEISDIKYRNGVIAGRVFGVAAKKAAMIRRTSLDEFNQWDSSGFPSVMRRILIAAMPEGYQPAIDATKNKLDEENDNEDWNSNEFENVTIHKDSVASLHDDRQAALLLDESTREEYLNSVADAANKAFGLNPDRVKEIQKVGDGLLRSAGMMPVNENGKPKSLSPEKKVLQMLATQELVARLRGQVPLGVGYTVLGRALGPDKIKSMLSFADKNKDDLDDLHLYTQAWLLKHKDDIGGIRLVSYRIPVSNDDIASEKELGKERKVAGGESEQRYVITPGAEMSAVTSAALDSLVDLKGKPIDLTSTKSGYFYTKKGETLPSKAFVSLLEKGGEHHAGRSYVAEASKIAEDIEKHNGIKIDPVTLSVAIRDSMNEVFVPSAAERKKEADISREAAKSPASVVHSGYELFDSKTGSRVRSIDVMPDLYQQPKTEQKTAFEEPAGAMKVITETPKSETTSVHEAILGPFRWDTVPTQKENFDLGSERITLKPELANPMDQGRSFYELWGDIEHRFPADAKTDKVTAAKNMLKRMIENDNKLASAFNITKQTLLGKASRGDRFTLMTNQPSSPTLAVGSALPEPAISVESLVVDLINEGFSPEAGGRGMLFQSEDQQQQVSPRPALTPKGMIDIEGAHKIITLFKGRADVSTILHEFVHWMDLSTFEGDGTNNKTVLEAVLGDNYQPFIDWASGKSKTKSGGTGKSHVLSNSEYSSWVGRLTAAISKIPGTGTEGVERLNDEFRKKDYNSWKPSSLRKSADNIEQRMEKFAHMQTPKAKFSRAKMKVEAKALRVLADLKDAQTGTDSTQAEIKQREDGTFSKDDWRKVKERIAVSLEQYLRQGHQSDAFRGMENDQERAAMRTLAQAISNIYKGIKGAIHGVGIDSAVFKAWDDVFIYGPGSKGPAHLNPFTERPGLRGKITEDQVKQFRDSRRLDHEPSQAEIEHMMEDISSSNDSIEGLPDPEGVLFSVAPPNAVDVQVSAPAATRAAMAVPSNFDFNLSSNGGNIPFGIKSIYRSVRNTIVTRGHAMADNGFMGWFFGHSTAFEIVQAGQNWKQAMSEEAKWMLTDLNNAIESHVATGGSFATRAARRNEVNPLLNTFLGDPNHLNRAAAFRALPTPELQSAAIRSRIFMNNLTDDLIRFGVIDSRLTAIISSMRGNMDFYIHRTYPGIKFVKNWRDVAARANWGPQINAIARVRNCSYNEACDIVAEVMSKLSSGDSEAHTGKSVAASIMMERTIPADIQEYLAPMLGVEVDPVANAKNTSFLLLQHLSETMTQAAVRDHGLRNGYIIHPDHGTFDRNDPRHAIILPRGNGERGLVDPTNAVSAAIYGPLSGYLTTPGLKEFYDNVFNENKSDARKMGPVMRKVMNAYLFFNGFAKKARTLYDPSKYGVNFASSTLSYMATGHFGGGIKNGFATYLSGKMDGPKSLAVLRAMGLQRNDYLQLIAAGALESSSLNEISYILADSERHARELANRARAGIASHTGGIVDEEARDVQRAAATAVNAATTLFSAGDILPKLFAYHAEIEGIRKAFPNMPDNQRQALAAQRTSRAMFTWARNPALVKAIARYMPLGGWATFPLGITRSLWQGIGISVGDIAEGAQRAARGEAGGAHQFTMGVKRAAGIIAVSSGLEVAAAHLMQALGWDKEKVQALVQTGCIPDFAKTEPFISLDPPTISNPRLIPLGPVLPFAYASKVVKGGLSLAQEFSDVVAISTSGDKDAADKAVLKFKSMLRDYAWAVSEPLTSRTASGNLVTGLIKNETNRGDALMVEGDVSGSIARISALMMNEVIPGIVVKAAKVGLIQPVPGMKGKMDGDELDHLSVMLGMPTFYADIPSGYKKTVSAAHDGIDAAERLFVRLITQKEPLSQGAFNKALDDTLQVQHYHLAKANQAFLAAKEFNIPDELLRSAAKEAFSMRSGALSKQEVWNIETGTLPGVLSISDAAMRVIETNEDPDRKHMINGAVLDGKLILNQTSKPSSFLRGNAALQDFQKEFRTSAGDAGLAPRTHDKSTPSASHP